MIDDLHAIINFATNKGVTGYHKPEDIDNEIHAVSMDLWMRFWKDYAKTQTLNDYMAPFEVQEILNPEESPEQLLAGEIQPLGSSVAMTKVIEHPTLVETGEGKRVKIVERAFWASERNDPVAPPTEDRPICCFASRSGGLFSIEFLPVTLTNVKVYGLRKPVKAVWPYTISSTGRRVFNVTDTTYQDLEWTELLFGTFRDQLLDNMMINLREFPMKAQAPQT